MQKNNKGTASEKPWKIKDKPQKKKMKKWVKVLLITLACIFGTILVAGIVAGVSFWVMMNRTPDQTEIANDFTNNTDMFDIPENNESDAVSTDSTKVGRKEGFYNILIIGRDRVALNTDVMICASFDTKNGKASTVQIPRDSYVEDADGNESKINAVFARGYVNARSELQRLKNAAKGKNDEEIAALCSSSSLDITAETLNAFISGKKTQDDLSTEYGIKLLQDVISHTFGIYFDYYAIVSTDAFVKIVDAVGGVDVYVEEAMHYDDPFQDLHIHIPAGQQHLDGKEAEGFVRFRAGYVQADIARLDAQKIFLTAFFKKLLSFSSVSKVDDIVRAVYDSVDTDMSLENAIGFVKPALSVDLSSITMLNMQGAPYRNGMYYSLNKAENLKIVNEHFNIFTHDLSESAVTVIELVESAPASDGESDGMTMEDISENQPSLGFVGSGYYGYQGSTSSNTGSTGSGAGTNTAPSSGSAGSETQAKTETETDSEPEAEPETDSASEPETPADIIADNTETEADAEADADADADTNTQTEEPADIVPTFPEDNISDNEAPTDEPSSDGDSTVTTPDDNTSEPLDESAHPEEDASSQNTDTDADAPAPQPEETANETETEQTSLVSTEESAA